MQQQESQIIYDIGAHKGLDTAYYLQKGYKVVAVEANPDLCSYLRHCFDAQIRQGKLILIEAAIADINDADVPFFLAGDSGESSLVDKRLKKLGLKYESVTVKTRTLDEIFSEFGKGFYCKMDIEGGDTAALKSFQRKDYRPKYFSVELCGLTLEEIILEPSELFSALQEFVRLGYNHFKVIDQYTLATLSGQKFYSATMKRSFRLLQKIQTVLRMPSQKFNPRDWYSRKLSYQFTLDASGPFGDDLLGDWSSAEKIRRIIKERFNEYYETEENKYHIFWVDLHAAQ